MARPNAKSMRRGSNTVELAIIAPVMVALMAGIIDYGWLIFTQQSASAAVRDAARIGSLTAFVDAPDEVAAQELRASLDGLGLSPERYSINAAFEGSAPEYSITVGVKVEPEVLFGLVPIPGTTYLETTLLMEDQSGPLDDSAGTEPIGG